MKTLTNITRSALKEAFVASRKEGLSKGTLILVRGDQRITCHGYRVIEEILVGDMFWLMNEQKELIPLEEGDTIQYSD
jgi:hypothetical protein